MTTKDLEVLIAPVAYLTPETDGDGKLWFRLDNLAATLKIDLHRRLVEPGMRVALIGTIQTVEHHGGYTRKIHVEAPWASKETEVTSSAKFTLDTHNIRLVLLAEEGK